MRIERSCNKQRFLDALARRPSAEVPFFECDVAARIVDRVLERPLNANLLRLNAHDQLEFLQRTGIDMGYVHVRCDIGRVNIVDEQGRVHYVDGKIKSRADFDQIEIPPLDPVCTRIEKILDATEKTNIGCVYALDEAARLARIAVGPTDFPIAMYDDPDFVHELMDHMEEYTLPLVERVLDYPIDALFLTGPVCTNQGPMFSPDMHHEFIFPRIEKMLELIHPSGVPVLLHTDGDNTLFMDWIVDTGFAGLHPVEPGTGRFDIYELKKAYGDSICLCGNIDVSSVLTYGTAEEVRADTLLHLDRLAENGGYICGSSHEITESVPFDNFRVMVETVCSYKKTSAK